MPMILDDVYGIGMVENIKDLAKQSLKNLLLSSPEEQIYYVGYGIGLENILFKNVVENEVDRIKSEVYSQTKKYIPYIEIIDCQLIINANSLHIMIKYYIKSTLEYDYLEMDLNTNGR